MKKKLVILILLLFPINVFAYSDRLIIPGKPVGIEVRAKGVYIVDFYKVDDEYIAKNQGFKIGDVITKVNNKDINNIDELNLILNKPDTYKITITRDGKTLDKDLTIKKENNIISTGLYVKDRISGIGTLSYIDPETKIFAALGHEIFEGSSSDKFLLDDGNIYDANINSINKSSSNDIGELHASITNKELGEINKNEINGIYGKYTDDISSDNLVDIDSYENIELGDAFIRLDLGDKKEDYSINIISLNNNDQVKNIFFEITDDRLLDKTGGVVQGMSGSPIIQNNKIIGVVNYVVVDDVKKGYGIFIEKMLDEGDKLLQQ